ncbi:GGDEF domain-containing response regulator [Aquabacterium parvum]|jgi:diguanylate cyclase (GGDEF)-like protein|uniref:GGDEF domain-containing response regulator n=1 Tax=Aquabacterium parvum TaxID=70584 RepID=UPI000718BB49|nr:diguanylate cyclase [Aquabacterium parvum]MBU0917736.1 diguanylate cyclase [Gammaproteobacteria bacterium]
MSIPALNILLVEDQTAVRKALGFQLQRQGHRVIEAADGQQALALFRSERPDLVLMDVVLPGEDGYWAAQQIRLLEGSDWTPIIFLSSRDSELDLQKGIEAGGDDYLFKPASPVVLAAKLHALTRLQRMRRQLIDTSEALRQANERLSHLSLLDELTQIGNRRSFDERLHQSVKACAREQQPLSLFLCDVDHFKAYNDHHGHLQGDACLKEIGQVLRGVCQRPQDHAARYGGEEFALILPNTPRSGAMTFARALQNMLARRSLNHPGSPFGCVTLSGGITTLVPDATTNAQQLVMRADQALYNAKAKGRNCYFSFEMQMDTHEQLQSILSH